MAEGKVADGWFQFDNDINSVIDGVAGNGVISGLTQAEDSPAAMIVVVAAGTYVANGTLVTKATATDVTIEAADGSNPRKDIIIADSSGNITVVKGTAAAAVPSGQTGPNTSTPVPGNITANKIILAEVWVGTGVTTILDANITDRRIIISKTLNMAKAYMSAHLVDAIRAQEGKVPLDAEDYDPGANFDASSWYSAQADADSDATHIQDDTYNFGLENGSLVGARVTWSSDSPPTANLGTGVVTAKANKVLTIAKATGGDFAASYYYVIAHAEYVVPLTGYYTVLAAVQYKAGTLEADKQYQARVRVNGESVSYASQHSSNTLALACVVVMDCHCSAGDEIDLSWYHSSTGGSEPDIVGVDSTKTFLCVKPFGG